MKFLITGGNFNNKGAQAMTFITCSELRTRYPDCEVIMADVCFTGKDTDPTLQFVRIQDCLSTRMILGGNLAEKLTGHLLLQFKKRKYKSDLGLQNLKDALNGVDAIFDVSGYSVGSNMTNKVNLTYVMLLKIAKKYKIPLYLLPQSFGPLHYTGLVGRYVNSSLKRYLKEAKVIFAREKEGYELLTHTYGLHNVEIATDMVIQNKQIRFELVRTGLQKKDYASLLGNNNVVGLIPSDNNYIFDNRDKVDGYYRDLIRSLLDKGHTVCMAYHAGNDRRICQRIMTMFPEEPRLVFIDDELDFYNFESLLDCFQYMISSRYHSIALAYKHTVPCVIFAWAVKYHEMADRFLQASYVVNVGTVTESSEITRVVDKMNNNFLFEKEKIRNILDEVQRGSCFERILNKEGEVE